MEWDLEIDAHASFLKNFTLESSIEPKGLKTFVKEFKTEKQKTWESDDDKFFQTLLE